MPFADCHLWGLNCWYEDETDRKSIRLKEVLDIHNQRVFNSGPTARSGHTLDLVISSNNCNFLINFETDNYFHSFHYPVYFEMAVKRRPTTNTEISYRDKRNFLPELFIENSCAALEAASETPCTCEGREGVVRDCLDCYAIFYKQEEHILNRFFPSVF